MADDTHQTFVERHLKTPVDEGRAALDREAVDVLRAQARRMRDLAFDLSEGERVFGPTRLSGLAVRRLEATASALERNVLQLLESIERQREAVAARAKERADREYHRRKSREWHARNRIRVAEERARIAAGRKPDGD